MDDEDKPFDLSVKPPVSDVISNRLSNHLNHHLNQLNQFNHLNQLNHHLVNHLVNNLNKSCPKSDLNVFQRSTSTTLSPLTLSPGNNSSNTPLSLITTGGGTTTTTTAPPSPTLTSPRITTPPIASPTTATTTTTTTTATPVNNNSHHHNNNNNNNHHINNNHLHHSDHHHHSHHHHLHHVSKLSSSNTTSKTSSTSSSSSTTSGTNPSGTTSKLITNLGPAPWIDRSLITPPSAILQGTLGAELDIVPGSKVDYINYVKRYANALDCGSDICRDRQYREHFHCLDCYSKVFVKKEEMTRHYKWHKKRDESLRNGFLRFSSLDDCSEKFPNCPHRMKQTHYHCLKPGCRKIYISTSDVSMHASCHRKDAAIIEQGFQRFRGTENCLLPSCTFYGRKTTHFHCIRDSCGYTFKNKADIEKHKTYHNKDEQLTREGYKKFLKHETCTFEDCRLSGNSNHIHCIRVGCNTVLQSQSQLNSHKKKHERKESESKNMSEASQHSADQGPENEASSAASSAPSNTSERPASGLSQPITQTYPTGTTLTSVDGFPIFKRKRGRPPKNKPESIDDGYYPSGPRRNLTESGNPPPLLANLHHPIPLGSILNLAAAAAAFIVGGHEMPPHAALANFGLPNFGLPELGEGGSST